VPGIDEQRTHPRWAHRAAPWAGWCLLFVPVTIVLHELGHYATARWLGGERSLAWSGLFIGTALGWALWMKLLGPVLFP
jgi:hypothetical protein